MLWIVFPGSRKSEAISNNCCETNWSSTNNIFTNGETICRKSGTGLGLTDRWMTMTMKVLVLNSGSSSQKSCLYEIGDTLPDDPPDCIWEAKIEWEDDNDKAQYSIKN